MREDRERIPAPSAEKPPVDIEKREQELNEVIPMLAHGLVRRLERKGLAGKVRVRAVAGSDWGVATSPENPVKDVPDVIVYPREYLSKDQRLVNARLRHEIGNLNYPIEEGLNDLRSWCEERAIAPALVTPLAQAIHEASVNYHEIQNAYSAHPEDNFKAMYEEEVDTAGIAEEIKDASPYKQAVSLTLLYSLSQTGIVPKEHFEQGLANAQSVVRDLFDARAQSVISQAVRMASPKKQTHLIREHLWPKFSQFATSADVSEAKPKSEQAEESAQAEAEKTESAGLSEIENMHRKVEEMREKVREAFKGRSKKEQQSQQKVEKRAERPKQELGPVEQQEREQAQDLLEQTLSDNLQNLQEQFQKAQEQAGKEPAPQASKPYTMEELAEQAKQLQEQLEALQQEAGQDQALQEQLEALTEQAEQIEDVAEYVSNPEEEVALEEDPITYNIKEYGIDESTLSEQQREILEKTRHFAQETSKVYRGVMRMLMQAYQQKNPNFTDKIISRIKEKGYDLPDFSLYGNEAAGEFLQNNEELGLDRLSGEDFLVNFNLPKPFGRFWYKGGQGSKSIPVKEGEIEWGEFYRQSMPVVWSAVDRAMMQGLYLQRLNEFGQHDYKKYYYLWEAMGLELPESAEDQGEQGEEAQEKGQESAEGQEGGETGEAGDEGAGEAGGDTQAGEGAGGEAGASAESGAGMPSAQEMQEFLNQMQESLGQAMEQGDMPGGQEAMEQMMSELQQMQEALESGANPQDIAGELSDMMGELSAMVEGMEAQGQASESQFEHPDPQLLQELQEFEQSIESQFSRQAEDDEYSLAEVDAETLDLKEEKFDPTETVAWRDAFGVKGESAGVRGVEFTGAQVIYGEPREIEYKRLSSQEVQKKYGEYEKEVQELTDDIVDFFKRKLYTDQGRQYERNQRRGARLQRGWQRNVIGIKARKAVVRPESFERRLPPEKSDITWSIILDNSLSCGGETFEQEKKFVVAMVEAGNELGIPVEVVTFTGMDEKFYTHLKKFTNTNQQDFMDKLVKLKANQSTWDSEVLEEIITKLEEKDENQEARHFVFSLTDAFHSICVHCDGAGGCSDPYHPESDPHRPDKLTKDILKEHGEDMVLMGIGFGDAAKLISVTWGENALEAPELDPRKFSEQFLQKVEEKMETSFR